MLVTEREERKPETYWNSLSLSLSLALSHTHKLSLSLSHTHTLSLSLSLTHTLSLSLSLTNTYTLMLSHEHPNAHIVSLAHTHALFLAISLFVFLSYDWHNFLSHSCLSFARFALFLSLSLSPFFLSLTPYSKWSSPFSSFFARSCFNLVFVFLFNFTLSKALFETQFSSHY